MARQDGSIKDNYATLRRQIREKSVGNLYIFHGEEDYLREHYVAELRRVTVAEGTGEFNWERVDGKRLTLSELYQMTAQMPLMGDKRMVCVSDYDFSKLSDHQKEEWAEFLEDVPGTCCLVFEYGQIPYKKDKKGPLAAVLEKCALTVTFTTPEETALLSWIARHAATSGKNITNDNAKYLVFLTGGNLRLLKNEIEKLCAYAKDQQITRQDMDDLVVPIPEAAAFRLGEIIAGGQLREAAVLLQTLKAMGEPPELLLGIVGKTLRGVYAARLAKDKRKSVTELQRMMGYKSAYPAEKLMRTAMKRDLTWCRRALQLCLQADERLKRGQYNERDRVMEWLLAALA